MAFNNCPIEVNQMIALELSDKDVASFRLVCRASNDAVDSDFNRFWFLRWRQLFDDPNGAQPGDHAETKKEYQARMSKMPKTIQFNTGLTKKEKSYLEAIKDIIIEAEPEVGDDYKISGRNITALEHFVKSTNIMDVIFTRAPKSARFGISQPGDELIHLVQLVLSALALRIEHRTVWSFDVSQRMAYMSMLAEPLFKGPSGTDVNIDWALHVVNFFRYHALRSEEGTLHGPWMDLTEQNDGLGLPQLMKAGLSNLGPASIGQNWKGTYAFLDRGEVRQIRNSTRGQGRLFQDKNIENGEGAIQRLKLEFPPTAKFNWPQLFEKHLDSVGFHHDRLDRLSGLNLPRVTRAQHSRMQAYGPQTLTYTKSRRFDGIGYDDEDFYGSGWINPLPAQHGIPGFKRMTMMKFFQDENGLVDANALWAYEGVVLPGDQIIVGRWWSPEGLDRESRQNVYSGPFILWNVDSLVQHKKDQQGEELDALLNP
ncbi:hypothetical protein EG328_002735 [Venturia inaequalis]|uniref:F-box domain-containing protein n=1 Tax=Venturia inaequalis TaxID=5025 RepID=A0A8H3UV02_VENIN|nr:hypothetical protein EG328_002735 [Venturia inaequalis]KAE9987923.1 hypothetical protein EG327_003609 [Venturia inaequalis]